MFAGVQKIIEDAKNGKLFILVDEANRENEGDLVISAELVTAQEVNFMLIHARGVLCLAIEEDLREKLKLDLLPKRNSGKYATNFATSFDAVGVETGVSAYERAKSIHVALMGDANIICTPGHINPLVAQKEGLRARRGHTEGSIAIMRLAGFKEPAAVICEIMKEDGYMAHLDDLKGFSIQHNINILHMSDLLDYALRYNDS